MYGECGENGMYDITFYYVTQDTRSLEVSVNGGEFARKYEFQGNGFSWASDGLAVKTVTIPLRAGENTLSWAMQMAGVRI